MRSSMCTSRVTNRDWQSRPRARPRYPQSVRPSWPPGPRPLAIDEVQPARVGSGGVGERLPRRSGADGGGDSAVAGAIRVQSVAQVVTVPQQRTDERDVAVLKGDV